jgi:hypothetical protein
VQQERAALGQLLAARRIYAYIMSALGIGALAAAVIVLVPTVIGVAVTSARDVLVGDDWWRDRIAVVVTLGLLGSPAWAYHWFSMQRRAETEGTEERTSLARRILVYGVLGAGTLALLGNLSYLLFLLLDALLEDTFSLTLLRDAKWSMGVMVAAVLIVPYYWLILQEDRRAAGSAARPPVVRKSVTLLIPEGGGAFVNQLEAALGGKVRVLHRVDPNAGVPELSEDDVKRLEDRIAEAAGSRVLLVADGAGVQVYSYR